MLTFIQNDPEVPAGSLALNLPCPHIIHHPYRDGFLPEPEDVSALIVLGGAMGANDDGQHPFLTGLKSLIRKLVAAGVPYLGVCLGGQILSAALGGEVVSHRWGERGASKITLTPAGSADPLFRGIPQEFTMFQWHDDSFDLPPGAVLLAASPVCPHQAFRMGDCAWGLQFHPEVDERIIVDWAARDPKHAGLTESLLADWQRTRDGYCRASQTMLKNFLSVSGLWS